MSLQYRAERQFMEGELDASLFSIAEGLGMTVAQLLNSVSPLELAQWRAFYVYRNEQFELARKKAEQR